MSEPFWGPEYVEPNEQTTSSPEITNIRLCTQAELNAAVAKARMEESDWFAKHGQDVIKVLHRIAANRAAARAEGQSCIGYPDCDGDLVATPHSKKCPGAPRKEGQS